MTLKIFQAKLPGKCATCQKEVQGSRVLYNKDKQLVHADCQFPSKSKGSYTAPRDTVAAGGRETPPALMLNQPPPDPLSEEDIAEMAKKAYKQAETLAEPSPDLIAVFMSAQLQSQSQQFRVECVLWEQSLKTGNITKVAKSKGVF